MVYLPRRLIPLTNSLVPPSRVPNPLMSHAFPVLTVWKPINGEHTCNKKERVTREHAYFAKGIQENTKKKKCY